MFGLKILNDYECICEFLFCTIKRRFFCEIRKKRLQTLNFLQLLFLNYLGRCPLFFGIALDKKCTTHAPIKKTTIKQRNTKNAFEKSKNI